jgi:DNA-binding GntR family transcriptional regulator
MAATLVKDPVYLQLNRALRELILNGEIAVGDRFPTERQVSTDFGVSRPTANKAISSLVGLRLADERPVILERRYVVAKQCPDLVRRDLLGSLYDLWTQKYRLEIAGADQAIRAICISAEDAQVLEVPNASAGFLVTSTGYLRSREPLWWEQTLYRGDTYEFRNQLGPIQSTGPTGGVLCVVRQTGEDL